ncbi:hypothetical protein OPV22_016503 [Ensete ventricosum]|uniref:Uncharacterized protein n=1 Tax=Ensete ventricosum TaxID=4639 RepID=A0AAV8QV62_ENSVE|nr:hypothetical protein OPV22_016503 [Ensete ventricosum]
MGIVVETMRPSKSLLPRPRRPYPSSTAHLPLPRRDPRPPWDPRRRRHLCPAARSRMIRPQSYFCTVVNNVNRGLRLSFKKMLKVKTHIRYRNG